MFRLKRVHVNRGHTTPETLIRNGSSSYPPPSDSANRNPNRDVEMRQRRTRLPVPPQRLALSSLGSPQSSRVFHIAYPKRTPPDTISASSQSSFNLRSSFVKLSFMTPRKFAVCFALLVISAMHVCTLYYYELLTNRRSIVYCVIVL